MNRLHTIRILTGLVLLCVGGYFAWEAHSILDAGLSQLGAMLNPDAEITSADVEALKSPAADVAYLFGADTSSNLEANLAVMRMGGIVVAVSGFFLTFSFQKR